MNRAIKRITKDIRDIYKNPLHDNKIYIHYDEENIFKMYCLMIGTEDTPYENGFYFFNFTFSEEYPLKPPKVEYCTLDANRTVRFNPNLYTCGKVCLSILGTWQGEQWSPLNSITTVLLAIQSFVLIKEPLRNEPGFERCRDDRIKKYDEIIYYENYRVAMLEMMKHTPHHFEVFKPIMINYYVENFDEIILKKYDELIDYFKKEYEGENIDKLKLNSVYNLSSKPKFSKLRDELVIMYNELLETQNFQERDNRAAAED